MKIEDWLRWPTNSTDPALNAAIAVLLGMTIIVAVAVGAMFLIPVAIVVGVAKGIHWYATRPTPTDQIFAAVEQRTIAANFPDADQFSEAFARRFLEATADRRPAWQLAVAMLKIAEQLYATESLTNPLPPLAASNAIEEGRYRDRLLAHQRKTADAPRTLETFNATLGRVFLDLIAAMPPAALASPEDFAKGEDLECFATFPLVDLLPDAAILWPMILAFFADEAEDIGLFAGLRDRLDRNVHDASGVEFPAPTHKLVTPERFKGTPREAVRAYLAGTPLEDLFEVPIPFALADAHRFEHMHVVGGTGHGKTQLLQHLIVHDLKRDAPPALVVIDSQGDMLARLQRLDFFATGGRLADRLIVIDPEDVAHPPALNMFALSSGRLGGYAPALREQVEAATIESFNYIFGALAAELTSRQNTTFAFVTRLMLAIPGATIHTLRELFEDGAQSIDASPFAEHIQRLDPTSRAWFQNQFFTRTSGPTKQQIARRLYGVLQVPAFDRMFASRQNRLDMFEVMQAGKIVLVNTSKALLKSDASALFGRAIIARVIAAAFERVAVPAPRRNPVFLIVDEAAEYFDESIETLLAQVRKFNIGVLLAHQHLDQLTPVLRAAVAANTSIKLAGGVSDRDARALAADMRTTPDFIAGMVKHARSTDFACAIRNFTANAVKLTVPFGTLEAAPRMSDEDHARLVAANRARIATVPDPPRPVATAPDASPPVAPTGVATPPEPVATDSPKLTDDWRS